MDLSLASGKSWYRLCIHFIQMKLCFLMVINTWFYSVFGLPAALLPAEISWFCAARREKTHG